MPKLTARSIAALKPRESLYRVADGDGLSLEVAPNGSRRWRFRYRTPDGREQMLSLGVYPEVGLAEARDRLAEARRMLRDGINPGAARKEARQAQVAAAAEEHAAAERDFAAVSEAWLQLNEPRWAPATARKARYVVERYLQPSLKGLDVATIGTVDARRAVAAVAASAPALAVKARGYIRGILEHAEHGGLREEGRAVNLRGSVAKREKGHLPAATTPDEVRTVLASVSGYESEVTRRALELLMLSAMRPGTVAGARWAEFELDAKGPDGKPAPLWSIPGNRMKTGLPHLVPLSRQAVEILHGMLPFTAGREFVFPALARQKTPHLHRDALSNALRRMGLQGKHSAHGFRAMFRTVARERLGIAPDVLEVALAHTKQGPHGAAYDRAQFLIERRAALQAWADYLDGLRPRTNRAA